ncbi:MULTISPECIES: hypothetical protein [unclassified Pseudomonas]|nr:MULTISPECIES: hypothetical protein [unclassified Pseudomonas]
MPVLRGADENHLSTGTLGWSDIENKAQFKSQRQGRQQWLVGFHQQHA